MDSFNNQKTLSIEELEKAKEHIVRLFRSVSEKAYKSEYIHSQSNMDLTAFIQGINAVEQCLERRQHTTVKAILPKPKVFGIPENATNKQKDLVQFLMWRKPRLQR